MDGLKSVIVGIDPGTTLGYAVLDLHGKLIKTRSSKNFGLNGLIAEITQIGKAISVGTDKSKVPSLVYKFSAKTGAKILHPKEDLAVEEKKKLTHGFKTENVHQSDALASSIFAFNRIRHVLDRIDSYVGENKKQRLKDKITDIVLTKELSIREAADFLENVDKKENRIIKKVVEEKLLDQNDFMKLYRIVKRYEKESYLLRKQNINLKASLKYLGKRYNFLSDKIRKTNFNEESKSKLLFKEKNIKHLNRELYNKDINIVLLKKRIKRFEGILSKWNGIVILKKLDNFGSSEFNRKKEFLNIKKEDILLLNNPDIISDHVIDFLKEKVSVVIAKTDVSKKIRERCPFIFLKYSDLNIQEDEFFAVVSKVELNQKLKSKETINQIVQNYKKQRTASLTNL